MVSAPAFHPAASMMIDAHTHVWESPEQLGHGAAAGIRRMVDQPWDRFDGSIAAFERAMQPVRCAFVLGSVSPSRGASITSEQVARIVAHRPGKYVGFASIDPTQKDAPAQLDRAQELGLVGVTVSPSGQMFHPMQDEAMRIFETCRDRGLPVIVQNDSLLDGNASLTLAQPHLFDEVAQKLPDLRLVISHLGDPWISQTLVMLSRHAHVFADISGLVSHPQRLYAALLEASQRRVMDKIFFASGFPFLSPAEAVMNVYSCHTMGRGSGMPAVPREALRGIVERDTMSMLGLALPKLEDDARLTEEQPTHEPPAPPTKIHGGIG